ncbi:hypothetical protein JR316_0006401 [Psilocybe cubensis]|uniref:Uncharacterized protein n=1 Tax=Psilocybe cubensis TaxID=181762 RepID=A0ACB8H2Z6_PSICU|nr:hypothetical protein JR316_0006401 [Psilocybe cubensis]KAH9481871.1 hypothetical protein JR316_0006401 [Psilocybe cubensis]
MLEASISKRRPQFEHQRQIWPYEIAETNNQHRVGPVSSVKELVISNARAVAFALFASHMINKTTTTNDQMQWCNGSDNTCHRQG